METLNQVKILFFLLLQVSIEKKDLFLFKKFYYILKKKLLFGKKRITKKVLGGLTAKISNQGVTFFLNSDIKNFVSFLSSKLKSFILLTGVISTAVPVRKTSSHVFKKSSLKCFS